MVQLQLSVTGEPHETDVYKRQLDGLLIPEDILTLQEYLGYLLIPSTKAQQMLVMTGKGGEGKSRIGLLLKKLFGDCLLYTSCLRSTPSGKYFRRFFILKFRTCFRCSQWTAANWYVA